MRNWKTTFGGLFLGILTSLGSMASERQANPQAPPITFHNVMPGVAIAVLGALSKDYDKSNAPNPVKEAQSTKE